MSVAAADADGAEASRPRGTRVLLWAVYACFAAACLSGALALFTHWHGQPFSRLVGLVLLLFGVFKILLAIDAVRAPTAVAPQSDQRQDTGSPGMFRLWVVYKLVPGSLAIAAAVFLFTHGSAFLDHLVFVR